MDERRRSTKTFKDGKEGLGQNGLYWKLVREISDSISPGDDEIMDKIHDKFKKMFSGGKSTAEMSVSEFWLFYTRCQAISCDGIEISGMDEDDAPFDHGGITE